MIFWDEPTTDDDHRRAAEAGAAATSRQARSDGIATWRLMHMKEPPMCCNCGRFYAFVQYHGKKYCNPCAPVQVTPINPNGGI